MTITAMSNVELKKAVSIANVLNGNTFDSLKSRIKASRGMIVMVLNGKAKSERVSLELVDYVNSTHPEIFELVKNHARNED